MKYSDVVANRRACLWRDVKAISPKPPKIQTANGTAICWGAWRHRMWRCSRYVEEFSLRLAVKQRQFGNFLLFSFPCRYCVYSLSFQKVCREILIYEKICPVAYIYATRLAYQFLATPTLDADIYATNQNIEKAWHSLVDWCLVNETVQPFCSCCSIRYPITSRHKQDRRLATTSEYFM